MVQAVRKDDPDASPHPAMAAPRRFTRLLRGTFHHYSAILRPPFGFVVRWLCRFLFAAWRLSDTDAQLIRDAAKRGPVLYVSRDKSRLEYLALAWSLARQDLPPPQFAHYVSMYPFLQLGPSIRRLVAVIAHWLEFRTYPNPYRNGYIDELFASQTPSLLCVAQFESMPRRFSRDGTDTLAEILRVSRGLLRPVQVVPIAVIYGRVPDQSTESILDLLFGPTSNPGALRRLWLAVRYRRSISLRVGEVESLETMAARVTRRSVPAAALAADELAYHLRRELIARLDDERRVVLGPIRKSRAEIVEAALHNAGLVSFLQEYCKATNQSYVETRKRAKRYLEEMAADYDPGVVAIMSGLLRTWLRRRQGELVVGKDGLEKVRRTMRQMPIVYVPCHKSHLDYLLVSYVLYKHRLSLPRILSGINLDFWPIGGFFRSSGAFFLRRVFKGKRVYSKCVAVYIETLLRERLNLEFFIEGGRSRVGKIIPPKLGFISILLDAFRKSGLHDLSFVPVLIDYERVFEEKTYLDEAGGRDDKGNKVRTVVENRKMVKRRIGEVVLEFDDPVSMRDLIHRSGYDAIPADRAGQMALASNIAYEVTWRINRRAKARPYALLATALLSSPKRGALLATLVEQVQLLQECIVSRGGELHDGERTGSEWIRGVIDRAARDKTVRIENDDADDPDETIVIVDEEQRLPLTLHRNSVIHEYQDVAIVAAAFLGADGPAPADHLFDTFVFIRSVLAAELIYGPRATHDEAHERAHFREALEYFTGKGFVAESDRGLVLSSAGRQAAWLFASTIHCYLESYYVVASTLWKHREKSYSDKDWLKRMMKRGRVLAGIGEIAYPEAVHRTHFETALRRFVAMGLARQEEHVGEKSRVTRKVMAQDFPALESTLDRLKAHIGRL